VGGLAVGGLRHAVALGRAAGPGWGGPGGRGKKNSMDDVLVGTLPQVVVPWFRSSRSTTMVSGNPPAPYRRLPRPRWVVGYFGLALTCPSCPSVLSVLVPGALRKGLSGRGLTGIVLDIVLDIVLACLGLRGGLLSRAFVIYYAVF